MELVDKLNDSDIGRKVIVRTILMSKDGQRVGGLTVCGEIIDATEEGLVLKSIPNVSLLYGDLSRLTKVRKFEYNQDSEIYLLN